MINGAGGIDAVQCVFFSFYPPLPTDISQQPGPGFVNVNNAPHRLCLVLGILSVIRLFVGVRLLDRMR